MLKDADKQQSLIRIVRRMLKSLDISDLRNIFFNHQVGSTLSEDASKSFIIEKIVNKVSAEELIQNRLLIFKMVEKINDLFSVFEIMLSSLKYEDLIQICRDMNRSDLESIKSKSNLIERMITEMPLSEIWKTKTMQRQFKPKPASTYSLKRMRADINALKKTIQELSEHQVNLISSISKIADNLQRFSLDMQKLANRLELNDLTDLETYLYAFYEQSLEIQKQISPEQLANASKEMPKKLDVDRWNFLIRGLEIMVLHYLLSQVKNLLWKPSFDDFLRITRKEFEKIKGVDGRAEIPVLREHVCRIMNISDEMFDNLLIDAWEKGLVRLDVGAPIGRLDVKYLKTKEGNLFYYVKFLE